AWFAFGKVLAYATLGGAAALLGVVLLQYLKSGIGNVLIGAASVLAGVWLIRHGQSTHRRCGLSRRQNMHPLLLGFSLSFIPCAPLSALLAACAAAESTVQGAAYGMVFGLGAALTPLFIVLPLLGKFGQVLRSRNPWLERGLVWLGGGVLVSIGGYRILLGL
ncbi:MAG: sulfite exporter TauE/SafE family protein, partial [Thiothrix sp.]